MEQEKRFREIDPKKGTFQLWDKVFNRWTDWQLDEHASPGVAILQDRIDQAQEKLSVEKPDGYAQWDRAKRTEWMTRHIEAMSAEEQDAYAMSVKRVTHMQLALICSYVNPVQPIPELWDDKIVYLASCLSHDDDTAAITRFFLAFLSGSTRSPEEQGGAVPDES